jgi:hypothetical protein
MRWINLLTGLVVVITTLNTSAMGADSGEPGVLDRPLPTTTTNAPTSASVVTNQSSEQSPAPQVIQNNLQAEYEQEQAVLNQLPEEELQAKAEQGERAAQVVLAETFAREATLLAFAPAAANDALSDAVRWYSLAASRGFPGAPSLDLAGVQVYPIRVQRQIP